SDKKLLEGISTVSNLILDSFQKGNKFLIAGNGGSAADSQHIAAEFVSRFYFDRPGLSAIALTTDTSMLTAIGNDYGFENLFSRQIEAHGNKGDVFIGISTSGNSKNVIKAVEAAKDLGVKTVALCGKLGDLGGLCDYSLPVPSTSTPHIQEAHICIGHMICAIVEEKMFGDRKC
ncbi:MAG: D-sedoheptulose 7-phosphate isomerase, partial [Colwellia sp.]